MENLSKLNQLRERILVGGEKLIIKKLSWAGIQVRTSSSSMLIDPLGFAAQSGEAPLVANMGQPLEPLLSLTECEKPAAILITHIHPDHFDPDGIKKAFGEDVPLYLPVESVKIAEKLGFKKVFGVRPDEEFLIDHFLVQVITAVDGFGTPQVSWKVNNGEESVFHSGDTLWHGLWWKIERKYGPFSLACLPVNGAILEIPGLKVQCDIKACMDPEEAVCAAKIVGAGKLLPIHYGTFDNPPYYSETENVIPRLRKAASKHGVELCVLKPGEEIDLKMANAAL